MERKKYMRENVLALANVVANVLTLQLLQMMWHINYVVLVLMMTYVLMPDIGGSCDIDVDIVPLPRTCASSFFKRKLYFFTLLMLKML